PVADRSGIRGPERCGLCPARRASSLASVPQPARSFRIRRARPADIAGLLALENASFATDRMGARQLRRHIDSSSAEFLVATDDAQVLGAALVFLRRRSAVARLYSIAVADAARGLGLGTRLLEAAER